MASVVSPKRSRVGRLSGFVGESPHLFYRLANAVGQIHTSSLRSAVTR